MAKKRSITTLYLLLALGLSTLVVILVGATMITINTQHYNGMVKQVSGRISKQIKEAMISRVERSISVIKHVHEDSEEYMKARLEKRVKEAHRQAESILSNNDDLSLAIQKKIIIDALRPIRFNFGRSAIFIANAHGKLKLNPRNISYEGLRFQDLKNDNTISQDEFEYLTALSQQVKNEGELFKHNDKAHLLNIQNTLTGIDNQGTGTLGFFKYLEPLDWIIGTTESIGEFEKETKERLLNTLSKV
jgi:hypothetical protein